MAIKISGKNLDIGDALRTQVLARLSAAFEKYSDGQGSGHVVVSRDGAGFRTDCLVSLTGGTSLEATGTAPDAYASFDQSAIRIEKRLRRYKRRITDRLGEHRVKADGQSAFQASAQESAYAILQGPEEDDDADFVEEAFHPLVIAETTKPLQRLSVSQAVLDLDLSGAPALVFRHAGHGRVNVVYRRLDGTIGWVDPPALDT